MTHPIDDCESTTHTDGLGAGLTRALAGTATLDPPGRWAALPDALVPTGARVARHDLARSEGVSLVARTGPRGRFDVRFGARLGAVRLGITRRLADAAVTHLGGRVSGGEPTLRKQLVAGTLADVAAATEAIRRCLHVAGHVPAAVADVHERLTALDWEIAKLLGAAGYLSDGPARGAHVARLVANCWVPTELPSRTRPAQARP